MGGPGGEPAAEVTICGDLSRRAAEILRRGSRYVLHGVSLTGSGELRSDRPIEMSGVQRVKLTSSIEMEFSQPHPLSASAVLRVTSRHRMSPACDGVVLVADTCIFGPSSSAHVVCPDALGTVVLLVGEDGQWRVKGSDNLRLDGNVIQGIVPLSFPCRLESGETVIALESLPRATAI